MQIQAKQLMTSWSARQASKPAAQASRVASDALVRSGSRLQQAAMPAATAGNQIAFHVTPDASREALLASIKGAQRSYFIETFIWHNDPAGQEILKALASRKAELAAQGKPFDVKILVDQLGLTFGSGGSKDAVVLEQMRSMGFEALAFNKKYINPLAHGGMPITHRKLYIADGEQFITGGRNIGNEYLKPTYGVKGKGVNEPSWHDLLYSVKGPETDRVLDEFYKNWQRAGGQLPAVKPHPKAPAVGDARVQSVVTNPHTRVYDIRKAHSQLIANAQKEIVAIYPYFSDDKLIKDLIKAKQARPQLSIKVLMPANREASHEGSIYQALNRETAEQLLKAGIQVRLFEGGMVDGKKVQRFSHMKAMMVDREVLSLGGANGDARTFTQNHELNTLIASPSAVADFRRQVVDPDWSAALPVTLDQLQGLPWKDKAKQKVLEALDFLL